VPSTAPPIPSWDDQPTAPPASVGKLAWTPLQLAWDIPADIADEVAGRAAVTIQARVRGKCARSSATKHETQPKRGAQRNEPVCIPDCISAVHPDVAESVRVGSASLLQLESVTEAEAEAEAETEAEAQSRFLDPEPPTTTQGPAISPRRRKSSLSSMLGLGRRRKSKE